MEEVLKFLKEAGAYFLATVDGDQPKVRPFGTADIFEGKLYIQTGKAKDVSRQIAANPKVQLCAMNRAGNEWLRVEGTLVEDDRLEPKVHMLEAYPSLKAMYKAEDPNTQVLYFKDAQAVFCSFGAAPRVVEF
ncbi:MAG: pyridoxamine 5'-phosphate oxidase family protein [Fibrobacter sp.]|nr:pyridoxamine 5'-phosphate oxidase family protein [Fibrobacter sp.]